MAVEDLIKDLKQGIGMVRVNAAAELGKLKDKRSEQVLIEALADSNMAVRNNAAFALGEMVSHAAVPHLVGCCKDPEERVRKSAVKALGMIKAQDAVEHLIRTLETDSSRVVKRSAIRSLSQIGGSRALRAVEPFVRDPEPSVADMAKKAVEKMKQ